MLFPLLMLGAAAGGAYYFWPQIKPAIFPHGVPAIPGLLPAGPASTEVMINPDGTASLPVYDYTPDLAPVGSASAGTYWPRSVAQDTNALRFLGFTSLTPSEVGGGVSTASDSRANAGAWNAGFRAAVTAFQQSSGSGVDGWIGPGTRMKLAQAVASKNAQNQAQNRSGGLGDASFAGRRARFAHARRLLERGY